MGDSLDLFFSFIKNLKANRVFKFISSVQLAIPLMLIVGASVAYGTIVESRYNAELAKMVVYQSWWFQSLLCILWINIFTSTISRIPYKFHHLGFVVTHIGLLTLLIGAMVTSQYGVDGQLRVVERTSNDTIILPELVLEIADPTTEQDESFFIERVNRALINHDLDFLNNKTADRLVVLKFVPYVSVSSEFKSQTEGEHGTALGFILKSQFFNVSEWLHSKERTELQLGPAHLKIVAHEVSSPTRSREPKSVPQRVESAKTTKGLELQIRKKGSADILAHFAISKLEKSSVKFKAMTIVLKKQFQQAVVAQGGLSEGGEQAKNPAIQIEISEGEKNLKEVIYSKFPNFTLNAGGIFGYTFNFVTPDFVADVSAATEEASLHGAGASMGHEETVTSGPTSTGNEIEFHTYRDQPDKVRVILYKDKKEIMNEWAVSGNVIQTPWMGITITVGSIQMNSASENIVTPIEPPFRSDLPPAALQVKLPGNSPPFWLVEGEPKKISQNGHDLEVYFGRRSLRLPFSIGLEKFYKKDYPGTQTPISYESDIHVNNLPGKIKIAMNEPLKYQGFVLYQSSFELNPGQPPASIFSVNQDPGRSIKYSGSLILVLGIVIFTLMRTSKFKKWRNQA